MQELARSVSSLELFNHFWTKKIHIYICIYIYIDIHMYVYTYMVGGVASLIVPFPLCSCSQVHLQWRHGWFSSAFLSLSVNVFVPLPLHQIIWAACNIRLFCPRLWSRSSIFCFPLCHFSASPLNISRRFYAQCLLLPKQNFASTCHVSLLKINRHIFFLGGEDVTCGYDRVE